MSKTTLRARAATLWGRLYRAERAVLLMLAAFAVKFIFSTLAVALPALRPLDLIGSGRHPVDVWLLLLSTTAVLGFACLLRRTIRACGAAPDRFAWGGWAVCTALNTAFYLQDFAGRHNLYLWDNATYYNLQIRLEANFAEGVFRGVGATVYKTWFNDYAPMVINLLAEPFFTWGDRTADSFALLCALAIPALVLLAAMVLLCTLARQWAPRAPRLFVALGLAFTLLMPLLHVALYRGMPDLLGVAFALLLLALAAGYDFSRPAPGRLVCMAALTAMLMLTRRCYMFWVAVFFALYGLWALARALRRRNKAAACRLLRFAGASLVCVGGPMLPMFWRIFKQDYTNRYATYQTGGFWSEVPHQWVLLGWLVGGMALTGLLWGLWHSKGRSAAVLSFAGALLTVLLVTRVQNMDDHQSLAVAPFYLLACYLCAWAVAALPHRLLRGGAAAVLTAACVVNFGGCAQRIPFFMPARFYSGTFFWLDGARNDLEMVEQVNGWLRANCQGANSAYMICHGTTYSADVFRAAALPDESIREILPYGACNPGNDPFPRGMFTAQVVLTCEPFDPNNHTEKIQQAFLENQRRYAPFEQAAVFDMGNGYTLTAWRRTAQPTVAEVKTYRTYLAEEDAQFPYNFSAVFDELEQQFAG